MHNKAAKELLITLQLTTLVIDCALDMRNDGRTTERTQRLQRRDTIQILLVVIFGKNMKEAAQKLGVGEWTLYRRSGSIPLLRRLVVLP
jgi:hypothetical protein